MGDPHLQPLSLKGRSQVEKIMGDPHPQPLSLKGEGRLKVR
jgi:hypothetical protein